MISSLLNIHQILNFEILESCDIKLFPLGMGRINMALERMPSENCLEPAGTTVSKKTSPKNFETADSIESATRKHSLGIPRKSSLTDKKPYLSRRRHTVGEVISPVTSTRKSSLANLHSFKVSLFCFLRILMD